MGLQQSKDELLYQQVSHGNTEAVKKLRNEGAGLEWTDKEGKTPLTLASMNPQLYDVAKTLTELGANVNAHRPGHHAGTPLHHAAQSGLVQTVNLLLSHGANALVMNDDSQTALDVARLKAPTQQEPTARSQLQPLPPPPPPPFSQLLPHEEDQICLAQNLQPPTQQQPTSRSQLQPLPSPPPSQLPLQPYTLTPPQPHEEELICLSQSQYRLPGSEPLPKGLVANTSDLQMQPLWGPRKKLNSTTSLFTAAVGIKQKETVDKMVRKFLSGDFSVMLFHYDGAVDGWKDLEWANSVIHVSAVNQTKWWFAKRFLHPDIVAEYSYVFVWDEDLGVDNFDPDRYLSIVKDEGLEISQPALDSTKSEVHHTITARWSNSIVHRRVKPGNKHGCDPTNDYPPCTGWVELMAPVFSRAAWRCIWYMIQSDLNHAWGLDILFGYCAQGERTKKVGVVDAEYVVHYGLPTFGEDQTKDNTDASEPNARLEVRRQSHHEYKIFKKRWQDAAKEDEYWVDPYPHSWNYSIM